MTASSMMSPPRPMTLPGFENGMAGRSGGAYSRRGGR